jgi:hypothetical protein
LSSNEWEPEKSDQFNKIHPFHIERVGGEKARPFLY